MKIENIPGEDRSWARLTTLDPAEVCGRTAARFDERSGTYSLDCYGCEIHVLPRDKRIFSNTQQGSELLGKVDASLSLLWYLASSHAIPPSGRLVTPGSLPGGQIFQVGTHVLPLEPLAEKYGRAPEDFTETGRAWGGEVLDYGDASVRLWPLPQVPTTLILRTADEEFPAQVNLLLDSNCRFQLPTDIIWATCMMSALILR